MEGNETEDVNNTWSVDAEEHEDEENFIIDSPGDTGEEKYGNERKIREDCVIFLYTKNIFFCIIFQINI